MTARWKPVKEVVEEAFGGVEDERAEDVRCPPPADVMR